MKKVISLLMSFVMLLSITAGVDLSVYADDVDHYLNFQADVYSSETAGFDNIFVGTDSSSFSRTFYNELKEDAKFQASLVLWSSTHIVDDPTYTIENNVFQKKDLYDAILFDMIDSTEKSTLYSQYGNEFTKLYAMVKNERSSYVIKTANKILGKEKYTVEQLKTTNLSEDAKDLLLNGTKYAGVTSVVSEVNDLLGKVKNAYDAINTVADYLAIKDVDYGTSEILNEIATDSQSPAELRISASQIKDCMSGAYGKTAALIVEGSISGIEFALNKAMNYAWDSVLACIPGGTAISFGAKTGRMLVNYFFKTETLIQGYYQLEAAVNIEDALIRAMQNKKNADTGYTNIDSAVYMKSVDMYKDIVLLGFDYSIELLQNAADSDFNTSTDFWLGNSSECLQLISQIEDFKQKKIDNFVCYEEIVFNKYKTIYFPNYDELEEEISKTVPVTSLNVTQLIDISVGDSDYFEDCFAYDYDPSNYTETTDVKVTSSNSNIISVVKADDSKEKFVANNAGTCTLTFTLNDRIACKRDVTVKPNSESGLITGECGESVKYSFDPSTGVLTIYGEGKMNNPHDHFASIPNIISVVIKYGVTSISSGAFYDCTSLTSVTIPNSVISIGDDAFINCSSLTNVTMPDSVISIGDYAFYECSSLTSVTIPDSVTSIDYRAFYNCSSLTNVTIGNSVTSIGGGAFEGCSSLTNVTIPDSVTSIGYRAFYNCSSLTNVTIGNSVTSIGGGAFKGCSSLTNVTMPDSVTSIGGDAFCQCSSLTSVTIPDSVTSIGDYTFENCTNLTSVTIPDSVTSIGKYAFSGCTNLGKVFYNGTIAQWKSINAEDNEYLIKSIIKCINGVIGNGNIEKIGDYEYQLNNDYTVSIVKCLNKSDTIIIPANTSYEGYKFDVTSIGANLFCDFSNLISVKIPDSVISIGINAFKNCVNLTSVSMSNSLISIGDSAFYGCTRLTNVTIPNSVTSIGGSAFRLCKSLTSVNIPNGVVSIEESVFCECIRLRKVYYNGTIAQWKSINFEYGNTYLAEAIIKCSDGVIGNRNIFTIDKIAYRLYNDSTASIDKYSNNSDGNDILTIPESILYEGFKFNITKIENYAFSYCGNLINVTIPNSVISIGNYAFESCTNLINVTISNKVTSVGNSAFKECTNLEKVFYNGTIAQWNSINFADGNLLLTEAVIKCTDGVIGNENIVTIDNVKYKIYNDNTATIVGYQNEPDVLVIPENIYYEGYKFRVINIGYFAFGRCTKLTSVTIPDSVTSIGDDAFSYCSSLTSVTIPDSVTSIGDYTFENCTNLTSVTIPDSVSSIGYRAFYNCSSLTNVTIGNSVTSIGGGAFKGCSSLTNVTIGNSVTSIGYFAFERCTKLTSVTIPDSVTSIGYSAFSYCSSLTSVTIPDSVTSIGDYAFSGCSSLTSVTIPDSVTSIGDYAFSVCTSLTSVTIPVSVTSIGDYAFKGCSSLTSVTIPDSVTSIGKYAFYNCPNLTSVTIPNGVTSISCSAFYDCTSLTSVTIPDSVTSIGDYAFHYCENLTDVFYTGTQEEWNKIAIGDYNECLKSSTIHYNFVPCSENKHNAFGEWEIVKEATCTSDGLKKRVCAYDGYFETEKIEKINHKYKQTVIAPTCTTEGYTVYKCTNCDNEYKSDYVDKSEHNFTKNAQFCLNGCGTVNPNFVDTETTINPEGTTNPETTTQPEGTTNPETTTQPEGTTNPETTTQPEGTTNPETTTQPESTTAPKTTTQPEGTTNPKQTTTSGGGSSGGGSIGGGGVAPAPETTTSENKKDEKQNSETTTNSNTSNGEGKTYTVKVYGTKAKKKAVVITWNTVKNVTGYQVQLATDKKFKKNKKTVTVKGKNKKKKTVKKLKAKKKYYVRIRSYKTVNGKKSYGKWSKAKSIKTK